MKKLLVTLVLITVACFTYAVGQKAYQAGQDLATPNPETATVSYIVDGDTIRVKLAGKFEYVRLIGVNAPELKSEDELDKCFAYKSKEQLLNLVKGKEIRLVSDPSQANRDRYQRLLRYVFVDGENINLELLENGFAYEYTYSKAYQYQKEFKTAQGLAEQNKLGIWGVCK